jgi:hypothetical protein
MHFNNPYVIATGVLILLWLIYFVLTRSWNPFKVVCGADGRPSTSKLQFWLWTIVVLFSYVAIYAARVKAGHFDAISDLPANVLIALGLSIFTATAAKGITVSYLQSGDVVKPPATSRTSGASQVLREDDGSLDLSKIQMLAWTVIAIGIYLINVGAQIKHGPYDKLPDIDAALMVLMGLGQGAYLGKKLVTTDVPRITAVSSQKTAGTTVITIQGDTFGQAQNGSLVTIDSLPLTAPITSWSNTQILFNLPATHPNGQAWTAGQQVLIGLSVNGHDSATRIPLTVP